jgi:hypothetical protein
LKFVPDNWRLLEVRQQPPIIAAQHPPGRLPPSHTAQFDAIADHLKHLTERLGSIATTDVDSINDRIDHQSTFQNRNGCLNGNVTALSPRNHYFIVVTEH